MTVGRAVDWDGSSPASGRVIVGAGMAGRCASLLLSLVVGLANLPGRADKPPAKASDFDGTVKPFLKTYCISCHGGDSPSGGLAFDAYQNEAHARKDRKTWEDVLKLVKSGEMPPKKAKAHPKPENRTAFLEAVTALVQVDCTGPKDPGRVTLRRLNRAEYNNTIRDLTGLDIRTADDFPLDDVGYGFDNIGDVLSMQPLMLEKYLAAADKLLDTALPDAPPLKSTNQVYKPQQIIADPRSAKIREKIKDRNVDRLEFKEAGTASIEKFYFPVDGEYIIRARVWASLHENDKELPRMRLSVGGKDLKDFDVERDGKGYEVKVTLPQGERRVAAAFLNPAKDGSRVLHVGTLEVEGPLNGETAVPAQMKKIITRLPGKDEDPVKHAKAVLTDFARRAYRRPVKDDELERLMKLFRLATDKGDRFDQALKLPLKAVLVSPHFLYRVEEDPKKPDEVKLISEYELATRLSYFLWSSMPDEELFQLAAKAELRKNLERQVRRMLKDPKASALTENFAGQWLMLRDVRSHAPDAATFFRWDEKLRQAAIRETEMFFEHIVKDDRSVLEFLDADYTFVNERLALHYGLPDVRGPEFRKVMVKDGRRGGLVSQASVLLVTSNPTRTSPVKRGKWIYENILGLAAPPPPPDVPELPPTKELKGTLRQQMDQHRANPSCAVCHDKLDPLGFGLENYDAIGRWREDDNKQKIDASGVLPDGSKFNGPKELRKTLIGKAGLFRSCLAEKLTTFALGRGLEYYDKCLIDELVVRLEKGGDKFSALALAIAESDAFQKRRGKRSE